MSKRIRTHKSRAIFAQDLQSTSNNTPAMNPTSQSSNRYNLTNPTNQTNTTNQFHQRNNEPYINEQNDNIVITGDNYKPNSTLMKISGFNELAPFIEANSKGKKTIDNVHDNNYNDYNEIGPNDINGGNYRQLLIKQMQESVFKQSNAMFGSNGYFKSNETPDYNNVQNTSFKSSNAQAVYLQRQSKKLFKNINEIISLSAYSNPLLGSVIFKIQSRALNLLILPYLINACNYSC